MARTQQAYNKPANQHKFALTAKSFFLQEAEGLSRAAKLTWARLRGAGEVTSLQHDGVVMVLSQGMSPTDACAALTDVCSAALGYALSLLRKSPFMLTWATRLTMTTRVWLILMHPEVPWQSP